MRHTTCFDTSQSLIYHQKPILFILCHITSYTTPSASFNFDQTSSTHCFQIQLQHKHSQYEAHDPFDTPQPLIYHHCTALKPIVCFYVTKIFILPLSLFQFDQTSSTHYFRYSFNINIVNMRHPLRYTPAPYIPPLYSLKANCMLFMSYNFLYDPLSIFQFR